MIPVGLVSIGFRTKGGFVFQSFSRLQRHTKKNLFQSRHHIILFEATGRSLASFLPSTVSVSNREQHQFHAV